MSNIKPLVNGSSVAFNIYAELPQLLLKNTDLALATVSGTKGSAPQKTGNSAVFNKNSLITGTIGGGFVEFSVQKIVDDAVRNKHSALHSFNLANELAAQDGSVCGGNMEVLLDAEPEKHIPVFNAINKSLSRREPGVMVINCRHESNGQLEIEREWITVQTIEAKAGSIKPGAFNLVKEMLENPVKGDFRRIDFDETTEEQRHSMFFESIVPPPLLIIAGAGHIGKALSHLGKMLAFEVVVWDYRSEYASKENLPDADVILSGSINTTLAKLATDLHTYVVAVTTGHKNDTEVLKTFINSPAGYIGMIGSRKKTILMRDQFLAEGWATKEQWEKVFAPIGLDICSETVEEIAVSIAAQLIQVRHQLNKRK